ncbi:MAG: calcium-binding protein [Cyanobacteriota bacterium]|jgi:Ca2+-binding RTX toxin-like protein
MPTVTTSSELRAAIQLASSLDGTEIIILDSVNAFSVDTLAKIVCIFPAPYPENGYTIQGNGQTIENTRIYQENIDGPYSPWNVVGASDFLNPLPITFSYTSGGATDGTALLRATSGSYFLDSLFFTGNHRGWDGNSNLYMSLTGFDAANPIAADLTLSNSVIEIKGQGNFNPAAPSTGGGSAFLHSFNNLGNISLYGNTFDEAEYLSSFNFFNQSTPWGSATVQSNLFTRSSNANVRRRGSRITNANVDLIDNTFENGAFIDVFGDLSGIAFRSDSVTGPGRSSFNTIDGGFGIRANYDATQGYVTGAISVFGTISFSGNGLPLKYEQYSSPAPGVFTLDAGLYGGNILISNSLITDHQVTQASAGGQADDLIDSLPDTSHLWAFGDLGNDTINGATEKDYLDGWIGNDSISGQDGADTILGGVGLDTIAGGAGDDLLLAGDDNDTIAAGAGDDSIDAGSGNDVVSGFSGNDTVVGGIGNDSLMGEANNDSIVAEDGNDTLSGGTSTDTLTGGLGNDLFVWTFTTTPSPSNDGIDTITDFTTTSPTADVDQMGLTDVFSNTTPGNTLNALDFSTALTIGAININDDNKVIRITSSQTNSAITTTTRLGLLNAYVLVFNSTASAGMLVFDADWGGTGGRTTAAIFSSINTLAGVSAFTNTNFYAV